MALSVTVSLSQKLESMIKDMELLYYGNATHDTQSSHFPNHTAPITSYTKFIYLLHRRRSPTMCSWLPNIPSGKRTVARKTVSPAIIKTPGLNIGKKTINKKTKNRKVASSTTSSSLDGKTRQTYNDALAMFLEAARNCEHIDNPNLEAYENFSRTRIGNDYWHTTRVPEGPRTHLILSKSEPHRGVDLVSANIAEQMEHIYQDLNEMSFQGLTSSTLDLNPALPRGQAVVSPLSTCESVR